MEQELQSAVELAEVWSAAVTKLEDEPGFVACFSSEQEAQLYTNRVNRATSSLIALRDMNIDRCVRVTVLSD